MAGLDLGILSEQGPRGAIRPLGSHAELSADPEVNLCLAVLAQASTNPPFKQLRIFPGAEYKIGRMVKLLRNLNSLALWHQIFSFGIAIYPVVLLASVPAAVDRSNAETIAVAAPRKNGAEGATWE